MTIKNSKEYKFNYFIFAALLGVLSLFVLHDFIFGMVTGAFLALSVWPLFEWLSEKDVKFFKGSVGDSALILTSLFTLILLSIIGYSIYEIYKLYNISDNYLNITTDHISAPSFLNKIPYNEKLLELWNSYIADSTGLLDLINKTTEGKLFDIATYLWGNVVEKSITLIVMIVTFYFSLKHGDKVKEQYSVFFSYWVGKQAVSHIDCAIGALRATMNGVVFIGLIEGLILSVPMILGGFSSGFLIAIIAGLLGVIPLVLPITIIPCFAYMYYIGNEFWAIIGFVVLSVVWFFFDNILKPQFIGKTVKINSFLILISMIGGLQLLGILGLLLGPAIVSMTIATLKDTLFNKDRFLENKS